MFSSYLGPVSASSRGTGSGMFLRAVKGAVVQRPKGGQRDEEGKLGNCRGGMLQGEGDGECQMALRLGRMRSGKSVDF